MPKVPSYTLAWSSTTRVYELSGMRDRGMLRIVPDSTEWFAWLDQVTSFAFSGKSGHYTARKETRQRGDRYWSAYLAKGTQLSKKYLGKTSHMTLARLEQIAGILCTQSEANCHFPSRGPRLALTMGQIASGILCLPGSHPHSLPCWLPSCMCHAREHTWSRGPNSSSDSGREQALTLISAPAGFGKTSLLAQWLAQSGLPVAWCCDWTWWINRPALAKPTSGGFW